MSLPNSVAAKRKILFQLTPDEDGYPPVSVEGLWVRPFRSGNVILDNIPFYARGIAPGDELTVFADTNGEIWFQALAKSGGRSVFRIYTGSDQQIKKIRKELLDLSVPSEVNAKTHLIAVEIPALTDIRPILDYLIVGKESSQFDFEEGVMRHSIPE